MLDFPRWKTISIWLIIILGLVFSIPSMVPEKTVESWPSFVPKERVNLGLDLAGGSHILLEADVADVTKMRLETMEKTVRSLMRGERGSGNSIEIGDVRRDNSKVSFTVNNPAQVQEARQRLDRETQVATGQRDWNITVADTNRFTLTPTKAGIDNAVNSAMDVATEVVRKRIDEMGTREPTIIRASADRIVVQVPGLQDPNALKELLGQTARLEFKMVNDEPDARAQAAQGVAPPGYEIVPSAEATGGTELLARQVMISGERLINATQGYDQNGRPVVDITFDSQGANTFARVTQQNTNKRFAMVLDGKVLSAPTINEPILGGRAQISGNFNVDSANQLAIALRSGALPVKLTVVEERTVGPDLGADSIRKGVLAGVIATTAVLVLMLVSYGRFGFYADVALVINIFLILAVMALFNATLTLPGIAGFVLTIGAAVDANVLINERIREELKRGRTAVMAIEHGYKEASRAIFDANITNVIAAALMFWFGSGPVKGFAVVLTIGIITSVFTAVTMTRMFVAHWVHKTRPTALNI